MSYDPFDPDAYSPAMTHWFGTPWPYPNLPAPICEEERFRIETPVGEKCLGCDEPIEAHESGIRMPYWDGEKSGWAYYHAECQLRNVMCPIEMGLIADPDGRHQHDPTKRREEGRLLMAWAQRHTA